MEYWNDGIMGNPREKLWNDFIPAFHLPGLYVLRVCAEDLLKE